MKSLLLQIFLLEINTYVQATTKCTTPDGFLGECINFNYCKFLFNLQRKPRRYRTVRENLLLQYSNCYHTNTRQNMNMVCCPYEPPTLVKVDPSYCKTLDGEVGVCTNLQLCSSLRHQLELPMAAKIMERLDMSRCGNQERPGVCCKYQSNAYPNEINSYQEKNFAPYNYCVLSTTPPEPQSGCCGIEATNSDRIIGGTETEIDEYPWLALIEYMSIETSYIEVGCGGSLISGKYVLTAAHCLRGNNVVAHIPVNVRLGEYNVSNTGPDCVTTPGGGEECTDGPVVIPIEQTIIHQLYNQHDEQIHNDIALIRLRTMAPYTDFIRPICLPTSDFSVLATKNQRLFASGWGFTETLESMSSVKRAVELPYMSIEECNEYYSNINIMLTKNQICAGGEWGKDSCKGDSGGPLMCLKGDLYEITGVVSLGPTICGQSIPSVYINVYQYLPWIWKHINEA